MRRADLAFVAATAASLALIAAGPLARRIELIGQDDLSRSWAGLRAVLLRRDPYDPATWTATAVAVALPLLPLRLLPLPAASILGLVATRASTSSSSHRSSPASPTSSSDRASVSRTRSA